MCTGARLLDRSNRSLAAFRLADPEPPAVETPSSRLGETQVDPSLVSQPLSRARATAGTLVLGIARENHVDLGVGDEPTLAADDRLVVLEPL